MLSKMGIDLFPFNQTLFGVDLWLSKMMKQIITSCHIIITFVSFLLNLLWQFACLIATEIKSSIWTTKQTLLLIFYRNQQVIALWIYFTIRWRLNMLHFLILDLLCCSEVITYLIYSILQVCNPSLPLFALKYSFTYTFLQRAVLE